MRYPASEKAEIIELIEQSHRPAKRTLDKLGAPGPRFVIKAANEFKDKTTASISSGRPTSI
jgi:hypothetical protein